jgi:hypothetical protein
MLGFDATSLQVTFRNCTLAEKEHVDSESLEIRRFAAFNLDIRSLPKYDRCEELQLGYSPYSP